MPNQYLDKNGLIYVWSKIKTLLAGKVDAVSGKGLSTEDYTTAEKTKLAGIASGANNYVLPKATTSSLGGIIVGDNLTIDSTGKISAIQGSYTLPTASSSVKGGVKIGSNLSMNGEVLNATDTTYGNATASVSGLMSSSDKSKLDGIASGATNVIVDATLSASSTNAIQNKAVYTALSGKVDKVSGKGLSTNDFTTTEKNKLAGIDENANNYVLPNAAADVLGGVKVGNNLTVGTDGTLSAIDTTYGEATTSASGLMSASDKTKLNGIATGANKTVVDASLTSTGTNPVQGSAIYSALGNKVDKVSGKGLSTNDYTTTEKTKLAGIAENANNYSLPAATSSALGGIKIGTNLTINESGVVSATDTKYSNATTSAPGLMSASDKSKLDGIASGATNVTVDGALSSSSTNPVQNKVVNAALAGKVNTVSGKGLSTNDYTTTEKTKLAGIADNANNYSLPIATASALGGIKIGTNLTINSSGVVSATDTTYSNASTSAPGLMSASDKSKLDGFQAASNYALKTDITNVYKYKGSVDTYNDLPSTGLTAGDVYNVETDSQNYAWTGEEWDSLGEIFHIDTISNSEIDTVFAS